jgi:hypothetical protein
MLFIASIIILTNGKVYFIVQLLIIYSWNGHLESVVLSWNQGYVLGPILFILYTTPLSHHITS